MINLIPRGFYLDDILDDMGKSVSTQMMKCDVYEKDGLYNIEMDIPGFNKEDIKIECNEGVLTITAEKAEEENDESKKYIRKERVYNKTSRSFSFADIDEDAIKAEFKNGTLLLTIPKKEKVETKKVINID